MILNSDIVLKHPLWVRADMELCSNKELGIFNRLVDVYIIACAIGIKEDKISSDSDDAEIKFIGRNTYMNMSNTDLRMLLDFMLQNAILHSKHIHYDIDERLKLAIHPDYTVPKLSAASFLTGFANYGIEKIFEKINSESPLVVISDLNEYFESLTSNNLSDLLSNIMLEEIGN